MAYINEIVLRDECRDLFNSHIVGLKDLRRTVLSVFETNARVLECCSWN